MNRLQSPLVTRGKFKPALISIVVLMIPLVFLIGCDRSDETKPVATSSPANNATSSPVKKDNYITATPNPVPAGPEPRGKSMIKWTTRDIPTGEVHVYVYEEGGKESLFSTGGEGSQEAPWIPDDRPVEFRLYSGAGSSRKLLDSVKVIRNK